MKNKFSLRGIASLFLASTMLFPAFADETHLVSTSGTPDVSHFPKLDQLPGKPPTHVYPGLGDVWAKRHEQWRTEAANDLGTVVFLGDSITQGWKTLAEDFPQLKTANRGIGGDISNGVLYRLQSDVLSLKPKAIVLLIGTNDLGDDADPEDVTRNIRLILDAIRNYDPKLKVVLCKVMPRADRQKHFSEKIQKLNSLVATSVKDDPNILICDTWKIFADGKGQPIPADFNADLLHLNAAGYVVWKEALTPVINKLNLSAPAK